MKPNRSCVNRTAAHAALAWLLLTGALTAGADTPPVQAAESASDALYECERTPPNTARAAELGAAQWDKNRLGCAADIWFAAAEAAPSDPSLALHALLAMTAYIDHLNTLWNYDVYNIHQVEWSARIEHAMSHGKALEARLTVHPIDDPNLLAALALYKLTWPVKTADTKGQIKESRAAIPLLERAVALDPKAFDGNALWMLGRVYYDLPEFAGGDQAKGLKLLADAYRNTPKNISLLRYTAHVYVDERDIPTAKRRLAELLPINPTPRDLQLMADELKSAYELADRLKDADLAKRLSAKRDVLLNATPQLLRRQNTAANLHGGVDPITGKDY